MSWPSWVMLARLLLPPNSCSTKASLRWPLWVVVAWLLTGQIRNPVMALLEQTRKVSAGDLAAHLDASQFNNDELGQLAKGFGEMQKNLRTLVSEVSGSVVQLSSAAEEISAVARQSANNMNSQQHELNQLTILRLREQAQTCS